MVVSTSPNCGIHESAYTVRSSGLLQVFKGNRSVCLKSQFIGVNVCRFCSSHEVI